MRIVFFCFVLSFFHNLHAQNELPNLLTQTSPTQHDSLYYEFFKTNRTTNTAAARGFAKRSLALSIKLHHPLLTVKSYNGLGFLSDKEGSYDSALYYYRNGIQVSLLINALERSVFLFNNLANVFEKQSHYDSAIYYYSQSLEYSTRIKSAADMAIARNNLGVTYYRIGSTQAALENFLSSYDIRRENNISEGWGSSMVNIAHCYIDQNDYPLANKFLSTFKEFCLTHTCDSATFADGLHALGTILSDQGKHKQALAEFTEANAIAKNINNSFLKTAILLSLGNEEILNGDSTRGTYLVTQAMSTARAQGFRKLTIEGYLIYANYYKSHQDYKNSTKYLEFFMLSKDSIINEKLTDNIKRTAVSEQRNYSDSIIFSQRQDLRFRQNILFTLLFLIAIIIIVTIFIFRKYQFTENIRKYLKTEIDQKTIALKVKNDQLIKAMRDYDHFIYKSSHDLRGPLSTMSGLIGISEKENDVSVVKQNMSALKGVLFGLDDKLANLTYVNQINQDPVLLEQYSIAKLSAEVFEKFKYYLNFGLVTLGVNGDGIAHVDVKLLTMCLERLVENSFNHIDHKSSIRYIQITIEEFAKQVEILVEDNGSGIETSDHNSIFDLFVVGHLFNNKKPNGVGLYIARLAIEKLGGTLELQNPAKPTCFKITIHKDPRDLIASTYPFSLQ